FESHNNEYPSLISSFYDQHTLEGVWLHEDARLQYEAMIKLRDLGANMPTGVPYTEKEILVMVIKGKQWGHIAGRGRKLAGISKSEVFSSQPQGTYTQPRIDQMLQERDERVVEVAREAKATRRELNKVMFVLRSNPQWAELVSQILSQSKIGEGSGSGGGNGDGGSGSGMARGNSMGMGYFV
ncbi:hypothetical protein Tco_0586556, partial [Tanacetum coccineum]